MEQKVNKLPPLIYLIPSLPVVPSPLLKNYLFIYLFMAALDLCCCVWAFSSCGEWGQLFDAVRGLLIVVASLVAEYGL